MHHSTRTRLKEAHEDPTCLKWHNRQGVCSQLEENYNFRHFKKVSGNTVASLFQSSQVKLAIKTVPILSHRRLLKNSLAMNLCGTVSAQRSCHKAYLCYSAITRKKTDQTGSNPTTHQISEPLPIAGTRSWEPGPGVPGMLGEYSPQRRGEERRDSSAGLRRGQQCSRPAAPAPAGTHDSSGKHLDGNGEEGCSSLLFRNSLLI